MFYAIYVYIYIYIYNIEVIRGLLVNKNRRQDLKNNIIFFNIIHPFSFGSTKFAIALSHSLEDCFLGVYL